MKITKLDNFGEGFTVTPRRPHTVNEVKPLTREEKTKTTVKVIKGRLSDHGICHLAIFPEKSRKNILAQFKKIQRQQVMNIEPVMIGNSVIAYRVIEQ